MIKLIYINLSHQYHITNAAQHRHALAGHSAPPDVIKVQNGKLFSMDSTLRDQSLRIWDLEDGKLLLQ